MEPDFSADSLLNFIILAKLCSLLRVLDSINFRFPEVLCFFRLPFLNFLQETAVAAPWFYLYANSGTFYYNNQVITYSAQIHFLYLSFCLLKICSVNLSYKLSKAANTSSVFESTSVLLTGCLCPQLLHSSLLIGIFLSMMKYGK